MILPSPLGHSHFPKRSLLSLDDPTLTSKQFPFPLGDPCFPCLLPPLLLAIPSLPARFPTQSQKKKSQIPHSPTHPASNSKQPGSGAREAKPEPKNPFFPLLFPAGFLQDASPAAGNAGLQHSSRDHSASLPISSHSLLAGMNHPPPTPSQTSAGTKKIPALVALFPSGFPSNPQGNGRRSFLVLGSKSSSGRGWEGSVPPKKSQEVLLVGIHH